MPESSATTRDPIPAMLRRDRWVVLGALAVLTLLTAVESHRFGEAMMRSGSPFSVSALDPWGPGELATIALMWGVMMVAMMTPTAAPMVLAFAGVERRRLALTQAPWATTIAFLGGYLLVWIGFSVLATFAQWGLRSAALLAPCAMRTASPGVAAALLIGAGLFQFSSAKSACLNHCRTPVGFLLAEWRDGPGGALRMGVRHGLYCTACCWLLMLLLFVVGVMNAACCAALSVLVLLEKVMPGGLWLARAAGVVLALSGVAAAAGTF